MKLLHAVYVAVQRLDTASQSGKAVGGGSGNILVLTVQQCADYSVYRWGELWVAHNVLQSVKTVVHDFVIGAKLPEKLQHVLGISAADYARNIVRHKVVHICAGVFVVKHYPAVVKFPAPCSVGIKQVGYLSEFLVFHTAASFHLFL